MDPQVGHFLLFLFFLVRDFGSLAKNSGPNPVGGGGGGDIVMKLEPFHLIKRLPLRTR